MINTPEEVKDLFKQSNIKKNFRVRFLNAPYDDLINDSIVADSVKFTEAVCSSGFTFGKCEDSTLEFQAHCEENLTGCTIEAQLEVDVSSYTHDAEETVTINSNGIYKYNPDAKKLKSVTMTSSYMFSIDFTLVKNGSSIFGRRQNSKSHSFDLSECTSASFTLNGVADSTVTMSKVCYPDYAQYEDDLDFPFYPIPYGKFVIKSCKRKANSKLRTVSAYTTNNVYSGATAVLEDKYGFNTITRIMLEMPMMNGGYINETPFHPYTVSIYELLASHYPSLPYVTDTKLEKRPTQQSYNTEEFTVNGTRYYVSAYANRFSSLKFDLYQIYETSLRGDFYVSGEYTDISEHIKYYNRFNPCEAFKKVVSEYFKQTEGITDLNLPSTFNNVCTHAVVNFRWATHATDNPASVYNGKTLVQLYDMPKRIYIGNDMYTGGFDQGYYYLWYIEVPSNIYLMKYYEHIGTFLPCALLAQNYDDEDDTESRLFVLKNSNGQSSYPSMLMKVPRLFMPVDASSNLSRYSAVEVGSTYNKTLDKVFSIFDMTEAYAELNAQFGIYSRSDGGYVLKQLRKRNGLTPLTSLTPSTSLVPVQGSDDVIRQDTYQKLWYDDTIPTVYGKVRCKFNYIKTNDDGTTEKIEETVEVNVIPDADQRDDYSVYDISSNYIVALCSEYGTTPESQYIAWCTNIANALKNFNYIAVDADQIGLPYVEAGDWLDYTTDDGSIYTFVARRTLSGIQKLKDSIETDIA